MHFFLSLWKDFHNKSAFGTNVWCMSAGLRWTMAGDRDRISLIPINIFFLFLEGSPKSEPRLAEVVSSVYHRDQ